MFGVIFVLSEIGDGIDFYESSFRFVVIFSTNTSFYILGCGGGVTDI